MAITVRIGGLNNRRRLLAVGTLIATSALVLPVSSMVASATGGTGSITGKITSGGVALTNACASATNGVTRVGSAPTTSTGIYTISNLAAGSYHLQIGDCSNNGPHTTVWYNGTTAGSLFEGGASPIAVGSTAVTGKNQALSVGSSISGSLQKTVSGTTSIADCVIVQAHSSSFPQLPAFTSTNTSGNYTLGGLPPGSYSVSFGPSDCHGDAFVAAYYNTAKTTTVGAEASPIHLVAPGSTGTSAATGISGVLTLGGSITGLVQDGSSNPLGGICVSADDGLGHTSTAVSAPSTATNFGHYTLTGLAVGSYSLQFRDCSGPMPHWATEYYKSAVNPLRATQVTVSGSTPATANMTMVPAGSISGTIYAGSGTTTPLSGVCMDVVSSVQQNIGWGAPPTSATGTYTVTGLAPGTYAVSFFPCGASSTSYLAQTYQNMPNGFGPAGGTPVVLTASHPAATGIDAHLVAGGYISGTVFQASSPTTAASGVCAFAQGGPSGTVSQPTTSNGQYRLGPLAPGSYDVQFYDCSGGGRTSKWYNGSTGAPAQGGATPVAVAAGATTSSINGDV